MPGAGPDSLRALLDAMRPDDGDEHVSLRQIMTPRSKGCVTTATLAASGSRAQPTA